MPMSVLAFGEALIDVYPDRSVVAGAPLHVAAHLATRGWTSRLMTRVGDDEAGRRILCVLAACGVDAGLVQVDPHVPTGNVSIDLDDGGGHTFTIQRPVAWDFIEGRQGSLGVGAGVRERIADREPPGTHDVLYFGTLAGRSPVSRGSLLRLLSSAGGSAAGTLVAFDANLRPPDVDDQVLGAGLAAATLVKVNEDELLEVAQRLGFEAAPGAYFDAAPHLQWLCVTRGARGAELHAREGRSWHVDAPSVHVVDTVGAGDAFSAGLVDVLAAGGDPVAALETGVASARSVLSRRGGLPECAAEG